MTKDEAQDLEHRYFFNHVGEYIPYWSRGVEAAKRGRGNKRQESGDRFTSSYAFVEDIARQEGANAERRGKMHDFFEMPTDKKVQRIDELIRSLQTMDDCQDIFPLL
ncbi:hypothetical protein ARMGADRAFT_1083741 [Armillaria gallica]|uniref:Uncharacterized protein n=1 Tax=Armillaria gallica TaxID=47427 RepID=A0A2H3D1S0_ARMGA|nr:hypothetical protein ARMGADRAFT_1083741 [Armillaria gallica]